MPSIWRHSPKVKVGQQFSVERAAGSGKGMILLPVLHPFAPDDC
jgi:hypothetical protein